jgi:outer membrane lipoprotein-sorting protein
MLLYSSVLCIAQEHRANNDVDPAAMDVLGKMSTAYANLGALKLTIRYYSHAAQLKPDMPSPAVDIADFKGSAMPRVLTLLADRPNRIRLSIDENGDDNPSIWDCDGHTLWSYLPNTEVGKQKGNFFTKSRAPGSFHDLLSMPAMSSGALELLMMAGVDPFKGLSTSVKSVHTEGHATIRGVETQVVEIHAKSPGDSLRVFFCIGDEDHLLYRLVIQVRQLPPQQNPGIVGDKFDCLVRHNNDPYATTAPMPATTQLMQIECDSTFTTPDSIPSSKFSFKVPQGAREFTPINQHAVFNGTSTLMDKATLPGLLGNLKRAKKW